MFRSIRSSAFALTIAAVPALASAGALSGSYQTVDWPTSVDNCQTRVLVALGANGWTNVSKGTGDTAKVGGVFADHGGYKGVGVCDSSHSVFTLTVVGPDGDTAASLSSAVMKSLEAS